MNPDRLARRAAWVALLIGVCAAHWWVAGQLPDSRFGDGAADDAPPPIDVAFVRELAPSLPPVHAVAAPPRAVRSVAEAAASPASAAPAASAASAAWAPDAAPSSPVVADAASAAASTVAPPAAAVAPPAGNGEEPAAALATASSASAPAAVAFDWPPSTRLSYVMEGQYRGPVYGNATVEWLRDGPHYQVRVEVSIPPLGGRRMLSDGQIGPDGLSPHRYDEETEIALRATLRQTVLFEPDRVLLANGKVNDPLPGVQDSASQFVQLTWLFLTRPELLHVGRTVQFPLALPRRMDRWTYDVAEQEILKLPFGEVSAFHLVPRPASRKANEWLVDIWIAPSLQYLPAKITMRMDAESYAELSLKSRPLQSGPPPAAGAAASSAGRIVR